MADDLELKKANPVSSAGKEFSELDETVVRFVSHDEVSGEELVSPTVHAILPIDSDKVVIGSKVAGGIIIRSMIGSGGMSSVYLGVQESIGRKVAVKVMHAHLLSDDSALLRFPFIFCVLLAQGMLAHPASGKVESIELEAPAVLNEGLVHARQLHQKRLADYALPQSLKIKKEKSSLVSFSDLNAAMSTWI
jgi:hypothetical protein